MITSGAQYQGVPTAELRKPASSGSLAAVPKSINFAKPALLTLASIAMSNVKLQGGVQDVVRFDVAMQHAMTVQKFQTLSQNN
jgi:hypothetical protein